MTRATPQRRRLAALGAAVLLFLPLAARGHWIAPREIIAGLNQNDELRARVGLVEARADADLPRLLLIRVRRETWDTIPPEQRLALAQRWYDDWRHNVDQGIVAVLDADTDEPLVNYDAAGKARLVASRRPTP